MLRTVITAMLLAGVPASTLAQQALESDQLPSNYTLSSNSHLTTSLAAAGGGVLGRRSNGALLGVDSLPNWSSYFYDPGFDSNGFTQFAWPYTMVGSSPLNSDGNWGRDGRTTNINAPIIPVNIDLRNFDGSPRFLNGIRLFLDATQYVTPVLKSPVFANSWFTSSDRPTQITDAVQRAEFFRQADDDWHTMLRPRVLPARTMVLIRGTYQFALKPDGTLRYVLVDLGTFVNKLFPPTETDTTTIMGAVENAGEIKTTDFSTFLFPDTYLFDGPDCCILGFHSYDLEPGSGANGWREKRYVMNYSSWISPGIFSGGFQDVTALSHEVAEAFNDPFTNNFTPWWLAPFGLCQNNLETGDVIEGMANATFPITLNGFTYHPQNEALLPWFAGVSPSPAIGHAYSYPDTTVLTSPAVSQNPGCTPPKP